MCGMWVLVVMGHLSLTLLTSLVLFVKKNHPHDHLPAVSSVPKTQKRITHQFLHATHNFCSMPRESISTCNTQNFAACPESQFLHATHKTLQHAQISTCIEHVLFWSTICTWWQSFSYWIKEGRGWGDEGMRDKNTKKMKENYIALTHSILIPRKTAPLGLSSSRHLSPVSSSSSSLFVFA